jgi:iron(III) transport system permease protein
MAVPAINPPPLSERLLAGSRRFFHWLTKPHVLLALIMLVIMFYMVVIPLYKLVETTLTWQLSDQGRVPDAVVGDFTLFHWIRMLTGIFGRIYTYTPLQHSMTIAIGTVLLSLLIGGSLA